MHHSEKNGWQLEKMGNIKKNVSQLENMSQLKIMRQSRKLVHS